MSFAFFTSAWILAGIFKAASGHTRSGRLHEIDAPFDAVQPLLVAIQAQHDLSVMTCLRRGRFGDLDFKRGQALPDVRHILREPIDLGVDPPQEDKHRVLGVAAHGHVHRVPVIIAPAQGIQGATPRTVNGFRRSPRPMSAKPEPNAGRDADGRVTRLTSTVSR